MNIYAVDPGNARSALVVFNGATVIRHVTADNTDLLIELGHRVRAKTDILVVEQIASFGMPVGAEVFETCVWSGRFIQAWEGYHAFMPWARVKRHEVKAALCGNQRAKDANIRQALLDRFGPGKEKAIGKKKTPGPLYGIAGDEWSALAVAVTYWDQHINVSQSERTAASV